MEKILILNGSPRATRSNSKRYAKLFSRHCPQETDYREIRKNNHAELRAGMEHHADLLLVFPLYADALPVGLLNFLKFLETTPPDHRPVVSVLVNCGFLEPQQCEVVVRMLRLFCQRNGYPFGSVLMVGGGEAILDSPFRFLVNRKIKHFAKSIAARQYGTWQTTMPIGKRLFVLASTQYWLQYGKRFGISKRQMQTPVIEGPDSE